MAKMTTATAFPEATILPVVDRCKREIRADIKRGTVPATVKSFAELHDYVDANDYSGACEVDANNGRGWWDGDEDERQEAMAFWNEVQGRVHQWLCDGRK